MSDEFKDVNQSIARVRSTVKFVRSSVSWFQNFKIAVEYAGITCKNSFVLMFLQDGTQCATLLMLDIVQEYIAIFTLMGEEDFNI